MRTTTSVKNLSLTNIVELVDFRSFFNSSNPTSNKGRPLLYQNWQLLAAIFIQNKYQISSDKELERQLNENTVFTKFCGLFRNIPSHDTISRFKQKLSMKKLKNIFYRLDRSLSDLGVFDNDHFCLDPTDVPTNSNPRRRTDKEAGFGHTSLDETFYGYWAMIATGSFSEIPRETVFTSGDTHQVDQALRIIPMLDKFHRRSDCAIIMDGIFDTKEVYRTCEENGFRPIIKFNKRKSKKKRLWELKRSNWRFDFDLPDRKVWELLYGLRIAAERVNSKLKELMNVRNVKVRGISNVSKHVLFACISLQIIALVTYRNLTKIKKWKQIMLKMV